MSKWAGLYLAKSERRIKRTAEDLQDACTLVCLVLNDWTPAGLAGSMLNKLKPLMRALFVALVSAVSGGNVCSSLLSI